MLVGYILAFASSVFFAESDIMIRRASEYLTPRINMTLTLLVGSPMLLVFALLSGEPAPLPEGVLVYMAIGVIHFYLGRLLFYTAIAGLGAASSAIISSPVPLTTSLLANLVLRESLTLQDALGLSMVSVAVYIASAHPSGAPLRGVSKGSSIAAGIGVISIFTFSTVAVRWASQVYGSPITGALASYSGALLIALAHMAINPGVQGVLRKPKHHIATALAGGVMVTLAQALRYLALSLIPVAHAVALISLFPVNTTVLASITPGLREEVKPRHLLAALIAVSGVVITVGV